MVRVWGCGLPHLHNMFQHWTPKISAQRSEAVERLEVGKRWKCQVCWPRLGRGVFNQMFGKITKSIQIQKIYPSTNWWFQPIWKNIRQIGSSPQVGVKIKNASNHHHSKLSVYFLKTAYKHCGSGQVVPIDGWEGWRWMALQSCCFKLRIAQLNCQFVLSFFRIFKTTTHTRSRNMFQWNMT